MLARSVLRTRAIRVPQAARHNVRQVRFASESAKSGASGGAVAGGLAGGAAALAIGYAWYSFSGAKTAVQSATQAHHYVQSVKDSLKVQLQEKTPDTNQAIQQLKQTALAYAGWVPGGRGYVEAAFKDLESIRQKHGGEVDKIVSEAYGELREVSQKGGMNFDTASDTYNVLSKHMERLISLASDASEDILNNHPELKERLGGSTDQLKQLGQRLGPQAKKEIDETWQQIREVVQTGLSADGLNKIRKLVQEKTEKLKELSEKAFNQGFEQLKPMLDKSPKVKKLVEENMDTLKQGNISDGIEKVRSAISSGSTEQLESYLQQAKSKAQQYSGGSFGQISQWLNMVPNGGQIISELEKVKDVAEKRGDEAQDIVKKIVSEIKQVLDRNSEDVQKLYEKGKQDIKKN